MAGARKGCWYSLRSALEIAHGGDKGFTAEARMVVIHGLSQLDPLAVDLAVKENIILGVTTFETPFKYVAG